MTNRSDLNECCAQIKLAKQLIAQPETFDLDKVLIELEAKKALLTKFMPRDYATILKGLESGALVSEEKKLQEPKIDEKAKAKAQEDADFDAKMKAKQEAEGLEAKKIAEEEAKTLKLAEKKRLAEEKAFQLKKQAEAIAKAEKLKTDAANTKAEKIAAKKAELKKLEE